MLDWKASIIGFHDPRNHHRLTPREFLAVYLRRLARKTSPEHRALYRWVQAHELLVLTYIRRTLVWRRRVF